MNDEEQVNEETSQTSAESEPNTEDQETERESVDSHEESSEQVSEDVVPKSEFDKVKQLADNYKVRAEKAEKKAKTTEKPVEQTQQQSGLTPTDLYALLQAQVPQEDIAEVTDYAKLKGISVTEALKSGVVKGILAEKAENRKVAAATNVSTTSRGTGKTSNESLLSNARSKGEIPTTDVDIQRLYEARQGAKRGK